MIQCALNRARRHPLSNCRTQVVKRENRPRGGPQQQVSLALDVVDIREEASHQDCGDQQRQRNKAFRYQDRIRFPARIADGISLVTRHNTSSWSETHRQPRHLYQRTVVRRRREIAPIHKIKYLRLWITNFSRCKCTSVLVAKETASRRLPIQYKGHGAFPLLGQLDLKKWFGYTESLNSRGKTP